MPDPPPTLRSRAKTGRDDTPGGWVEVVRQGPAVGDATATTPLAPASEGHLVSSDAPPSASPAFGEAGGGDDAVTPGADAPQRVVLLATLGILYTRGGQLITPFYGNGNRRRRQALIWTAISIATLATESWVLVAFSNRQRDFTNAMSERNEPAFWEAIYGFAYLLLAAVVVYSTAHYAEAVVRQELRRFLTEQVLDLYLLSSQGKAAPYYRIAEEQGAMDNPGQRIVDDARCCGDHAVTLASTLIEKGVKIASFSVILYGISPWLLAFALAYAIAGSLLSAQLFAAQLLHLRNAAITAEAGLRHFLIYIHQYREEIAMYRGGSRERRACGAKFQEITHLEGRAAELDAFVEVFRTLFSHLTVLLPYVVLAGPFFAGDIAFGQVSQTGGAFYHIRSGLGVVGGRLTFFTATATHLQRLGSLVESLRAAPHGTTPAAGCRILRSEVEGLEGFVFSNVTIRVPAPLGEPGGSNGSRAGSVSRAGGGAGGDGGALGRVLCRGLDFELRRGMRLLITGPNGSGKTSILRAVAGLFCSGAGEIRCPASKMFLLPQRLYSPLGGLRTQLRYPKEGGGDAGDSDDDCDDADLVNLLHKVGLDGLPARVGGWSSGDGLEQGRRDFLHILSPGEQQRIGFARMLRAHPRVALLDEATSAMDEAAEDQLYELLQRVVPTYVTVGHRALCHHHTHVLSPHPSDTTQWRLRTVEAHLKNIEASRE